MNLGESIDRLYELKQEKAELNRQIKDLDDQYAEIEANVLAQLNELGVETGKSGTASATVSRSIVPNVDDWDAFYNYIVESNQPYLLERRPSVTAFRDLTQAGESIPGVSSYTKISLSLRKNR